MTLSSIQSTTGTSTDQSLRLTSGRIGPPGTTYWVPGGS